MDKDLTERLEEQINDLTELHQNEIQNIKQVMINSFYITTFHVFNGGCIVVLNKKTKIFSEKPFLWPS